MELKAAIRGTTYRFDTVKEVLAKANPPKSGDDLAGISARDPVERVAARAVLSELTLAELRQNPVVPYEEDELTRMVEDTLDEQAFRAVKDLTVGQFREWLLDTRTPGMAVRSVAPGLTPEMAAAAAKLMSNMDLMIAGAKCQAQADVIRFGSLDRDLFGHIRAGLRRIWQIHGKSTSHTGNCQRKNC